MAKKRKDQRLIVGEEVEKQVLSLIDPQHAKDLIEMRSALQQQIELVEEALRSAPTDLMASSVAQGTGRRGEASFEIDPDGRMVIVVSYGGEACEPLSRTSLKPAWTKRNERKPRTPKSVATPETTSPTPEPDPPKKKGFIKTSVAVSETKVLNLDDILQGFDDEPEDEIDTVVEDTVYESAYVPDKKQKKLRRLPNQKVKRGSITTSSLADLAQKAKGAIGGED